VGVAQATVVVAAAVSAAALVGSFCGFSVKFSNFLVSQNGSMGINRQGVNAR
jgi:hypothetical protein